MHERGRRRVKVVQYSLSFGSNLQLTSEAGRRGWTEWNFDGMR